MSEYPPLRPQPPLRRRARGPSPTSLIAGIVVLSILVVVLLIILLTGGPDGDGASATDAPSGSAGPSGSPGASVPPGETPVPTPTPEPTPPPPVVAAPAGILPVGSVVEVTADQLRIRQAPATSAPIVATVNAGEQLYLVTSARELGPVETAGFQWYRVLYAAGHVDWPAPPPTDAQLGGWVAAGSASESFLSLAPAMCPIGEPDIRALYALTAWERLACFGDRQIVVEGTFGCAGCAGEATGTFTPEWLAHPINFNILQPPLSDPVPVIEYMLLRVAPEIPQLAPEQAGAVLRVTGHLNDARSVDCVVAPGEPGQERPANDLAAEWYCREQFVVDSWEVIGTDPAFEAG